MYAPDLFFHVLYTFCVIIMHCIRSHTSLERIARGLAASGSAAVGAEAARHLTRLVGEAARLAAVTFSCVRAHVHSPN
jgi:hypothetical protein